jgi:hypothetical protein
MIAFLRRHALLIIIGLSVLVRLADALVLGNNVNPEPGIFDQVSYHTLAVRLLSGHGFTFDTIWWPVTPAGQPTAHWSYLYTFYLVAVYALAGVAPLAPLLLQAAAVGAIMPWLAQRLARRVFAHLPQKVEGIALAAAAWTAGYGYFAYYAGALMTESFYMLGLMWIMDCALRLSSTPAAPVLNRPRSWLPWLELGLAVGLTALLRQVFLPFLLLLGLWLGWVWLKEARLGAVIRRLAGGAALALAVAAVLILPVTLWNYHQFGEFVLLNTNAGYAFFWGNHPIYGDHFVSILTPQMGTYQDLIPTELRSLNEAALDKSLLGIALDWIRTDPGRYLRLSISRIPAYFIFWPSPDSGMLSNVVRVASFGLALPFMLVGIFLWGRGLKRAGFNFAAATRAPGALLLLFVASYTAIHLLSWALVRYRLPVDAFLLIFAAAPLAMGAGWVWKAR